ncbi:hypothetical protein QCD70_17075 [Agreia sp. PsM10]|uniref:hypothetical protein n=1 Tax=Agreia sp. PsM10 TaxID=3030533 RepID=UPI00263B9A4A|nr:hypothetical protein [Agreia sp. PsM10]MDN4641964.1 hypothetical protein [Agreia sp. PsM10]
MKDVTLLLTTNGTTPDPGKTVTVTLPSGLTWSDGTTTPKVFTTDASGNVTLTGIKATSAAGTPTITATSSTGPTAAAVVTVTPATTSAHTYIPGNPVWNWSSVPSGATAIGNGVFLAQNGDLYQNNTVIASGVTSANHVFAPGPGPRITWVNASGGHNSTDGGATVTNYPAVPTGSTAIGNGMFLTPSGEVWSTNAPLVVNGVPLTGVTSAIYELPDSSGRLNYVTSTGGHTYIPGNPTVWNWSSVPSGATAIGNGVFLAQNGDLYQNNTVIASGVTSANHVFAPGPGPRITWVNASGGHNSTDGGATVTNYPAVPTGSTAIGNGMFLTPSGEVWSTNAPLVVNGVPLTGVTSAIYELPDSSGRLNYMAGPTC